jgi:FMN phosphatase YigB (HAD superfamily)
MCLVSDFTMPAPPVTQAKIATLFDEYLSLLDGFGLRSFFEPVEEHITLSTHAGVNKPDRRIFEMAIERLGMTAQLLECLFITEAVAHLNAASALGMQTIPFNAPGGFTDWADAPLLVAKKVSGPEKTNI